MGRKMTAKERREYEKTLNTMLKIILFPFSLPGWIQKQLKKKRRRR